jgi:hypothetical protein
MYYNNKEANESRIKIYMDDWNHIVDVHDSFAILAFIDLPTVRNFQDETVLFGADMAYNCFTFARTLKKS